jgi:pimeloyl-ACP methyl ester carboxylesterase
MRILAFLTAILLLSPMPQDYSERTVGDEQYSMTVRHYPAPFGGAPNIVLVHDWGGDMDRWNDVAHKLQELGFGVILFNLAGHGGDAVPYYRFSNEHMDLLRRQVALALRFAREQGSVVHLLGAGLGANLALEAALDSTFVSRIVAVSPGLDYRGVKLTERMAEELPGKVLFIASQEDSYSVHSIEVFVRHAGEEEPGTRFYSNVGHGVWILKRLPESLATIARWLTENPE